MKNTQCEMEEDLDFSDLSDLDAGALSFDDDDFPFSQAPSVNGDIRQCEYEATSKLPLSAVRQPSAVVPEEIFIPEPLRMDPFSSRYGLLYASTTDLRKALEQLEKHLVMPFRGSMKFLPDSCSFSVNLGISGFQRSVSHLFLPESSFVPSYRNRPLISPETLRCRIDLPMWLLLVLQKAIEGSAPSKRLFQRHFVIEDEADLEGFFEAVISARTANPRIKVHKFTLVGVILTFKLYAKEFVGKMLEKTVSIASKQHMSLTKDLNVQAIPFYFIRDVSLFIPDKQTEVTKRYRKMLRELTVTWTDEAIDYMYPIHSDGIEEDTSNIVHSNEEYGLWQSRCIQVSRQEAETDFREEQLATLTLSCEDEKVDHPNCKSSDGDVKDGMGAVSSEAKLAPTKELSSSDDEVQSPLSKKLKETMLALRDSSDPVERRFHQTVLERIVMEANGNLKIPKGVFSQDGDKEEAEKILSNLARNPTYHIQYEARRYLYSWLSPWKLPIPDSEVDKVFSMLTPLIETLRMIGKLSNCRQRTVCRNIVKTILPRVNERILLPRDMFDSAADILRVEELLETCKYERDKYASREARKKLFNFIYSRRKRPFQIRSDPELAG
jgi:hypothetical protein